MSCFGFFRKFEPFRPLLHDWPFVPDEFSSISPFRLCHNNQPRAETVMKCCFQTSFIIHVGLCWRWEWQFWIRVKMWRLPRPRFGPAWRPLLLELWIMVSGGFRGFRGAWVPETAASGLNRSHSSSFPCYCLLSCLHAKRGLEKSWTEAEMGHMPPPTPPTLPPLLVSLEFLSCSRASLDSTIALDLFQPLSLCWEMILLAILELFLFP